MGGQAKAVGAPARPTKPENNGSAGQNPKPAVGHRLPTWSNDDGGKGRTMPADIAPRVVGPSRGTPTATMPGTAGT
eukprot:1361459-Alexandrium_andersonii.AAC.1